MKISVYSFFERSYQCLADWTKAKPGRYVYAISNGIPSGYYGIDKIIPLLPAWNEVTYFKQFHDWDRFTVAYLNKITAQMGSMNVETYIKSLLPADAKEVIFLCWEAETNPHCHRKLLYDMLPVEMRGVRH